MTARPEQKWRRFERLVKQIQETLTPEADIRFDERIMGSLSKTLRQFDVTVRQDGILTVFDCKDYRKPIDVKDVEQFIPMVEDVEANHAVIVSAKGFSLPAINRGKAAGIDLFTVVDAERHDWHTYLTIPVLEDCRAIRAWRPKVADYRPEQYTMSLDLVLVTAAGETIGAIRDVIGQVVLRDQRLQEPGEHENIPLGDDLIFVQGVAGLLVPLDILVDITVEQELTFMQLPLTTMKGFRDVTTGGFLTRGFITEWIDVSGSATWAQRIASRDDLAVRPLITQVTMQNTL